MMSSPTSCKKWYAVNRASRLVSMKRWDDNHPEKKRESVWKARNIRNADGTVFSWNNYQSLLVRLGSKCQICGTDKPGGKGDWHVDHNHYTHIVRGILCTKCNLRVGYYETSNLDAIRTYLDSYALCQPIQH